MSRIKRLLLTILAAALVTGCDAYLAGDNSDGQLGTGALAGYVDVGSPWLEMEAGILHTCGITAAKTLWCWGDNPRGQVGNGTTTGEQFTPYQVDSNTDWDHVAPGYRHTCATRAGQLWCWGSDLSGQLGNGAAMTDRQGSPVRVGTATDWDKVASGWNHSCATRTNGDLYCWGLNSNGQLGIGNTTDKDTPVQILLGPWKDIDGGRNHTCGILISGRAYCWGSNSEGQIGNNGVLIGGNRLNPLLSVFPSSNTPWLSISAGGDTSCGVLPPKEGEPAWRTRGYCWGSNDEGQIRPIADGDAATPVRLTAFFENCGGLDCFVIGADYQESVSVGEMTVCSIKTGSVAEGTDGGVIFPPMYLQQRGVRCFGDDTYNQQDIASLDVGAATERSVSVGLRHSVLLTWEQ